jgi:UDP-N-acetyl-D-mannosaminuronate dehydrogenase
MKRAGAEVKAWEPFKPDARLEGVDVARSLEAALEGADAIVLLVKHTEFVRLDPEAIAAKTTARILIDCVNGWNSDRWQKAGFTVHRLGVNKAEQTTLVGQNP